MGRWIKAPARMKRSFRRSRITWRSSTAKRIGARISSRISGSSAAAGPTSTNPSISIGSSWIPSHWFGSMQRIVGLKLFSKTISPAVSKKSWEKAGNWSTCFWICSRNISRTNKAQDIPFCSSNNHRLWNCPYHCFYRPVCSRQNANFGRPNNCLKKNHKWSIN